MESTVERFLDGFVPCPVDSRLNETAGADTDVLVAQMLADILATQSAASQAGAKA